MSARKGETRIKVKLFLLIFFHLSLLEKPESYDLKRGEFEKHVLRLEKRREVSNEEFEPLLRTLEIGRTAGRQLCRWATVDREKLCEGRVGFSAVSAMWNTIARR